MKALLIGATALALMVAGFLLLKLPPPAIIVAPEAVFHVSGIDITNTMFTSWFVVAILVLLAFFAGRGVKLIPSGFSAYVEAAVMAFYDIVEQVAGPVNGRRFFPLAGTIFFFILISNYLGLLPINNIIGVPEVGHGEVQPVFQQTTLAGIDFAYLPLQVDTVDTAAGEAELLPEGYTPEHEGGEAVGVGVGTEGNEATAGGGSAPEGGLHETGATERTTDGSFSGILAPYFRSVNTDINAPMAIAIWSFLFVEFWGLQSLGMTYLGKFFAFGALKKGPLGLIDVFVGLLEFVSELSRIVSFTFRLFGNIFAGEVLLLMMTFLVPFVLVDAFYGLELFVGLIQAFVFAMLTTVFAVTAVSHHGGEHDVDLHEAEELEEEAHHHHESQHVPAHEAAR